MKPIIRTNEEGEFTIYENLYYAAQDAMIDPDEVEIILLSAAIHLSITSGSSFNGYHYRYSDLDFNDARQKYEQID